MCFKIEIEIVAILQLTGDVQFNPRLARLVAKSQDL
jgi:hypothetical protein